MPTIKKRVPRRQGRLSDYQFEHLFTGLSISPSSEGARQGFPFLSEEHRREMWRTYRGELMAAAKTGRTRGFYTGDWDTSERPKAYYDYEVKHEST